MASACHNFCRQCLTRRPVLHAFLLWETQQFAPWQIKQEAYAHNLVLHNMKLDTPSLGQGFGSFSVSFLLGLSRR